MSQNQRVVLDWIFGTITAATAAISALDSLEQWIRIILAVLSCISVVMLIVINRKKFIKEVRSMLSKCPDE